MDEPDPVTIRAAIAGDLAVFEEPARRGQVPVLAARGAPVAGVPPRAGPGGRRRRMAIIAAVAGLVAAAIGGGLLLAPDGRIPPAAAEVPRRVRQAQLGVETLVARMRVTERGWQDAVPERTFAGELAFRSPEHLALTLVDLTEYPSPGWLPADIKVVRRPGTWWAAGHRACALPAGPACGAAPIETTAVVGLEPLDQTVPSPLDLVVPVNSFLRATAPEPLGSTIVAGRPAFGVATTAAQVDSLFDGLRAAGNLRPFFPGDRVELWLDEQSLVPLAVRVSAVDDPDRPVWAAAHGSVDRPGDQLLDYEVTDLVINGSVPDAAFVPPPPDAVTRSAGFAATIDAAAGAAGVRPSPPPAGLRPGPAATSGMTAVRTWVSGRGWVKVRAVAGWTGPELAGGGPGPVRAVALTDGSPAFVDDGLGVVLVHGSRFDVAVSGSVPVADLLAVASSLGIAGHPVPAGWREAPVASPATAARALPGVALPGGLDGSEGLAVRIDDGAVTATVVGAGRRAVVLTASAGTRLGPPFDMAVVAVDVRGAAGRYGAARGELEWVEGGIVYSLRSTTLTRAGLQAVAAGLAPP